MATFLLVLFTAVLLIGGIFVVLLILMQKPSANAGMGSALGGGAAETAFGAQAGNMLTRLTIIGTAAFFVISFSLYLGWLSHAGEDARAKAMLSDLELPADESLTEAEAVEDSLTDIPVETDTPAAEGELIVVEEVTETVAVEAETTAEEVQIQVEETVEAIESNKEAPEAVDTK